jgi:hypothetical protein
LTVSTFAIFGVISACSESAAAPQITPEVPVTERPENTTFEDVLAEYQAFNQRLSRVVAPLRIANAALCPDTVRDPGFYTHRLEDYPTSIRPMAEIMLGLESKGLFVREVRSDTSAAEQRLEPGDQIVAVNENPISSDPIMSTYNEAVLRNGFDSVLSKVKIRTPEGREYLARIRPQTACDIPAKVVFSEQVNGHTDGRDVLMTSALMTSVPDDTNLALVIAHEMGHVIAGHAEKPQSQALELEADRMALVLMARSGYDVNGALTYWERAAHPHEGGVSGDSSHPSTLARYENFQSELSRINKYQRKSGSLKDLNFE